MAAWDIDVVVKQLATWHAFYSDQEQDEENFKAWMWTAAKGKQSALEIEDFPAVAKPMAPPHAFEGYEEGILLPDSEPMDETESWDSMQSGDFSAEEFAMIMQPFPGANTGQHHHHHRRGLSANLGAEKLAKLLEDYPRGRYSEQELEEAYKAHIMVVPVKPSATGVLA